MDDAFTLTKCSDSQADAWRHMGCTPGLSCIDEFNVRERWLEEVCETFGECPARKAAGDAYTLPVADGAIVKPSRECLVTKSLA
jgi:hypothetical protein